MQAMISSDFLIEPAFANEKQLQKSVSDIVKINKMVNDDYQVDIVTQDDLIKKLSDAGLYPCERVFRENIAKYYFDEEVSSKDIVTMVHNIVQRSEELSLYTDLFEIEFDNVDIIPDKKEISSRCCIDSLVYDFMMISLINEIYKYNLSFIVGGNEQVTNFNLKSEKVVIYAEEQSEFIDYEKELVLTSSVDEFLINVGSEVIWNRASNDYILALAIYTRVLELRLSSGEIYDDEFTLDSFVIGDAFFDSLHTYQCGPSERFGNACFEAIARLIFGSPKEELNVFRASSEKGAKQRTRGDDLAYRTHVTKGGEGIRLMVWHLPTGEFELANVGNKFDLHIEA